MLLFDLGTNQIESSVFSVTTKTKFKFRGVDVCQPFFLYAFGCGVKRYQNVLKQFKGKGITPGRHENAASIKTLAKVASTADLCRDAITFILHFAQENALQLPGRLIKPGKTDTAPSVYQDLYLLPNQANLGRREIYERYEHASREELPSPHRETVSYALWTELWDLHCAHVLTITGQMELCPHCRAYYHFIGSTKGSSSSSTSTSTSTSNDAELIRRALEYAVHLNAAQGEVAAFRATVDRCRAGYQSLLAGHKTDFSSALKASFMAELPAMHYTVDWFSTVCLPAASGGASGSFVGSSLHFHSAYRVALFGVAIEPLRQFLLYIVPEFIAHNRSTLASLAVSLLEHAFTVAGPFKERQALVDCLNCAPDQAKSSLLVAYLSWRTLVGKHDSVSLNFLPPGHLHTWNDLFMGALKKRLRSCTVTSLADIKSVAESCAFANQELEENGSGGVDFSTKGGEEEVLTAKDRPPPQKRSLVRAFLVGDDAESVTLPLYDWATKLAPIAKLSPAVLQANSHYQVDIDCPGFVVCNAKTSYAAAQAAAAAASSSTTTQSISHSYRLVSNEAITRLDAELPGKLHLEPLPLERRLYLYRTIRPYVEAAEKLKAAKRKRERGANGFKDSAVAVEAFCPPVSKLWAVDEALLADEKETEACASFSKAKRKLKNQPKETTSAKKTAPRCSYCGELGHRETAFGNVCCPKKKLDGQMPTTTTTTENSSLPLVSLFDEEDYEDNELDFELDENVFNGIVSEAEDIQQQQQHQHYQSQSQ